MVEYTLDEALTLLERNAKLTQETLDQVNEELGFIHEQITTCEVNMARVYNNDVRVRRKKDGKD